MNLPFSLFLVFGTLLPVAVAEPNADLFTLSTVLTYNNQPLGSRSEPLVLRTFMPDPGLGSEVLIRHQRGARSPKYNLREGKDIAGEFEPIDGLPAAIGVNFGEELSYCWDSVECRLLYAWEGGFLNMKNYWGDPERGNRQSFGYVPELEGILFYQASGKHPLMIGGKSLSELKKAPAFRGFHRKGKEISFRFEAGGREVLCEVRKGTGQYSLEVVYRLLGEGALSYLPGLAGHEVQQESEGELRVCIQGHQRGHYRASVAADLLVGGITAQSGERIFAAMACATCHSLDGSKGHGPSLLGVFGSERKIKEEAEMIMADDDYILESIRVPNAKVVDGFPENYMPPYQLKEDEERALLLFLKTIKK